MMANATDNGKWETVVNKKKGQVSRNDVRKAKENFLGNPTHVKADIKNPLEEAATIYSAAFDNKENQQSEDKYPSFHSTESTKRGPSASPGKSTQKHKKHAKPAKPSPLEGIDEKIAKLNGESLSLIIKGVQDRFPTHSLIWLKEIASWLQKELAGPAERDLMLSSLPKGFPENLLTSNIRDQVKKVLKKSSDQSVEMLFCFCITLMLDDLKQGKSTIALRILLQLVIDHMPKVLLTKMEEVLNGKGVSQESFLVVIWAYSQYNNDLASGIKVWWTIMFPLLRVGTHALHVVSYFEELLEKHKAAKFSSQLIDGSKFVDILKITFSPKSPVANSPSLKHKFEKLYPTLKRMYFSDKTEQVNSEKFKQLLHIVAVDDKPLQLEILRLLVFCLSREPDCFVFWVKNLEKFLKQSSVLWSYIYDNFDVVNKEISSCRKYKGRNIIRNRAAEFYTKLQEMKKKGMGSKVGFSDSFHACQKFLRKEPVRPAKKFTMMSLLKYMFIGLLMLSAVDIYRSKGFKGSTTETAAVNLGIDGHVSAMFLQLESLAGIAGRWSRENLSPYYAKVHYYLEPSMEIGWNYSVCAYNSVYEFSKPGLQFLSKTTETVFVKIDELLPGYIDKVTDNMKYLWSSIFPTVHRYVDITVKFISEKTPIAIAYISSVLHATVQWIYELHPAFFDSAKMHAHCAMNCALRYANDSWAVLVKYTPVVMETSVEYVRWIGAVMQQYLSAGQTWLQNSLRSSNIGNSGATK